MCECDNGEVRSAQTVPAPSLECVPSLQRGTTEDRRDGFSVVKKRIQWTASLDQELLREYERSQPSVTGYMRRLEALWNEKHPDLPSTGTALSQRVRRSRVNTQPTPIGNQPDKTGEPQAEGYDTQVRRGDKENDGRRPTGAAQSPAALGSQQTLDNPIPSGETSQQQRTSLPPSEGSAPSANILRNPGSKPSNEHHQSHETLVGGGMEGDQLEEVLVISEELREEFLTELREMEGCGEGDLSKRGRPRIKGIEADRKLITQIDELICEAWNTRTGKTLWRLNCLVYAW